MLFECSILKVFAVSEIVQNCADEGISRFLANGFLWKKRLWNPAGEMRVLPYLRGEPIEINRMYCWSVVKKAMKANM